MPIDRYPLTVQSGQVAEIQRRLELLEDQPTNGNLLPNGGFEDWNVGDAEPQNWSAFWSAGTRTGSKDSSQYYKGSSSWKALLGTDGFMRFGSPEFRVSPGDLLIGRWWGRTDTLAQGRQDMMMHTNVMPNSPDFFQTGVAQLGATQYTFTAANTWQQFTQAFVVPDTHTRARIYVTCARQSAGADISLWVDQVSVVNPVPTSGIPNPPWIAPTLGNGWSNYDGTFEQAGYVKINGIVYLRGLIKAGSAAAVFNLPTGYRPAYSGIYQQHAGGGSVRVDVLPGGDVTVGGYYAAGTNSYVSLNGISFPAMQ